MTRNFSHSQKKLKQSRVHLVRMIVGPYHLVIHTIIRNVVFVLDMTMVIFVSLICVFYDYDGNRMFEMVFVV